MFAGNDVLVLINRTGMLLLLGTIVYQCWPLAVPRRSQLVNDRLLLWRKLTLRMEISEAIVGTWPTFMYWEILVRRSL